MLYHEHRNYDHTKFNIQVRPLSKWIAKALHVVTVTLFKHELKCQNDIDS